MASQTLLLVDSDARSMRMLEVSLRKAGYDVVMAHDGAEAMAAIARQTPDLILSDTRLPPPEGDSAAPRDGYEFCERLKGDDGHTRIPFIFLTGSADLEDKIRGLKLGVEDYLTKPIYLKELLTRVGLVLARKRRDTLNASTRALFVGELAGMGLVDLLTTVDLGRKTGVIEIDGPEGKGALTFRDGVVLDAKTGCARGDRAVFRMLRWSDGRFEVRFGAASAPDEVETTVSLGTQGLMLEGLRRADEWNHAEAQLGAPLEASWVIDRDLAAQVDHELDVALRALVARFDRPRSLLDAIDEGRDDLADLHGLAELAQRGILHRVGEPRLPAARERSGRPTVPGFAQHAAPSIDEAMAFLEAPEATDPHAGARDGGTNAAKTPTEIETPATRTSNPSPQEPARLDAPPRGRDARDARMTRQERDVAKHKQKRQKGNRESGAPSAPSSGPGATVVTPKEAPLAQPVAVATARAESSLTDKGLRVEGNVIHLPSSVEPVASPANADDSGAHPSAKPEPAADVSVLREAQGERERTTIPPDTKADEKAEAKPDAKADDKPEVKADEKAEAKADEKPAAKADEKPAAKADEKPAAKADEKPAVPEMKSLTPTERPGAKPDEKGRAAKADILSTRKEAKGREHKESLSTHLSDEARAFFTEQAYQAAYKTDHDSFEDLAPAHEEHPSEVARSRRWMTAAGGVFVALLVVVVGFAAYHSQYAVHETALDTTRLASHGNEPIAPPEAQPTPPPANNPTPEAQPTPPPANTAPPATGPEAQPPTPPATGPEAQPPTPPATATGPEAQPPVAAPPVAAPPVAAPPVAAPPVAAPPAPTGQTPQQLLAAARTFRGALPGRIAAYNAYFDAAPTDDRTMTTFAMSLAEMNRSVDAEAIATRATTANPRNGQAWFVLAYARNAQHNAAGAREAKTRCIEIGGQWAAECRAL